MQGVHQTTFHLFIQPCFQGAAGSLPRSFLPLTTPTLLLGCFKALSPDSSPQPSVASLAMPNPWHLSALLTASRQVPKGPRCSVPPHPSPTSHLLTMSLYLWHLSTILQNSSSKLYLMGNPLWSLQLQQKGVLLFSGSHSSADPCLSCQSALGIQEFSLHEFHMHNKLQIWNTLGGGVMGHIEHVQSFFFWFSP